MVSVVGRLDVNANLFEADIGIEISEQIVVSFNDCIQFVAKAQVNRQVRIHAPIVSHVPSKRP